MFSCDKAHLYLPVFLLAEKKDTLSCDKAQLYLPVFLLAEKNLCMLILSPQKSSRELLTTVFIFFNILLKVEFEIDH